MDTLEPCLAHTVNGGWNLCHYEPFNVEECPCIWLLSNTGELHAERWGALGSDQAGSTHPWRTGSIAERDIQILIYTKRWEGICAPPLR